MKKELLKELNLSFENYFVDFNSKSKELIINLNSIISDYLSLKEDNETNEEELKLIEKHLSALIVIKKSGEYLSNTKDIEALYNEFFPIEKRNLIRFFGTFEQKPKGEVFLANQMKNMLDWFDEAIKVIPQKHYQSIKITKEKILIECEALAEKIDYYNTKDMKIFDKFHNPAYFCIENLKKQKEIIRMV